jgi:hypothetical protein
MNRKTQESGQALVAATFCLVALLGAAGLAVDIGYLRYQKRLQQSAADSAALAGAAEIAFGGSTTNAAREDSSLNGFPHDGIVNGQTDPLYKITVTVNKPPASGPNALNANSVEVLVSAVQPVFFMKIFGVTPPTLTARAVALLGGKGPKNCIYSLDLTGPIDNDATLNVPNCGIIGNQDMYNDGSITAASVGLVGSAGGNPPNPAAVGGIVPAADPLSYLPAPAIGGCLPPNAGVVTATNPPAPPVLVTLNPGTYCGGISVSGGRSVKLNPGTYVITGTGISFSGSGTVSGTGVTFYLSGAGGAVNFNATQTFDLSAPTAGAYAGILFYQSPGNTSTATINGAGGSELQGGFYFPNAHLIMNGAGTGAAYMIFVVQSLAFNTNISFLSDYSSLPNGSPIKDAVLVE